MSPSPIHRCQTPHDVFRVIAEAKAEMIPVVPLIGAGLSLEAGVPTTPHMIEYMSKVKFLLDLHHRWDGEDLDYAEPLEIEGWPDPGKINDLLLDRLRDRRSLDPRPSWFRDYEALESNFLGRGGDRLESVRLFTLHQYLSQVQPSVLKIVSDFGGCPVMGAFAGEVRRILDQVTAGRARLEPGEEARLLKGLKGLMKENGMRDQVLQNLTQDWRGMLRFLTSGIPGLVDSFFQRLLRDHHPSIGHQFLALMAESHGWRLWLTTNFDDLIERALRDQRIETAVFELPDSGPVPDSRLFHDLPSVVKLHGSGFALRVGESLDTPLDPTNLEMFGEYLENDAIVLVLGYGGGDRRVMSLIEDMIHNHTYEGIPKVIWIHRGKGPPDGLIRAARGEKRHRRGEQVDPRSVYALQYRSGGMFLRELYEHLSGGHAASRVEYHALPMLPPRAAFEEASAPGSDGRATAPEPPVTLYWAEDQDDRTAEALLAQVNRLADKYQVIWCDLSEIATVDELTSIILEELYRLDPGLVPGAGFAAPGGDGDRGHLAAMVRRLSRALRRGRYVVSLDGSSGFGRDPLAHHILGPPGLTPRPVDPGGRDPLKVRNVLRAYRECPGTQPGGSGHAPTYAVNRLADLAGRAPESDEALHTFLRLLCGDPCLDTGLPDYPPDLGESRICAALKSEAVPEGAALALAELQDFARRRGRRGSAALRLREALDQTRAAIDAAHESTARALGGFVKHCRAAGEMRVRDVDLTTRGRRPLTVFDPPRSPEPDDRHRELLRVASAYRRPRHILAFKFLAERRPIGGAPGAGGGWEEVNRAIGDLAGSGFLVYQEGGFYQMATRVRDRIVEEFARDSRDGSLPLSLGCVHTVAAIYYDDLFRRSNSLPALFESIYHRVAAYRMDDSAGLVALLDDLGAWIGRAERFLREGPPVQVATWLRALRAQVQEIAEGRAAELTEPLRASVSRLARSLDDLLAHVLFAAGDDEACVAIRGELVRGAIGHPAGACAPRLDDILAWADAPAPDGPDAHHIRSLVAADLMAAGRSLAPLEGQRLMRARSVLNLSAREAFEGALKICKPLLARHGPARQADRRRAWETTYAAHLGLADLALDEIARASGRELKRAISDFSQEHAHARHALRHCSLSFKRNYANAWAGLALRSARRRYLRAGKTNDEKRLKSRFCKAYTALESARAEAYVGRGVEDREALIEVRLRTAEARLIHAQWYLDASGSEPTLHIDANTLRIKARQARFALDQARSTLSGDSHHYRAWAEWEELNRRCDELFKGLEAYAARRGSPTVSPRRDPPGPSSTTARRDADLLNAFAGSREGEPPGEPQPPHRGAHASR
jgi:hypothetical protein